MFIVSIIHKFTVFIGTLSVRVVTFEKLMAKISDFYSSFTNEWAYILIPKTSFMLI